MKKSGECDLTISKLSNKLPSYLEEIINLHNRFSDTKVFLSLAFDHDMELIVDINLPKGAYYYEIPAMKSPMKMKFNVKSETGKNFFRVFYVNNTDFNVLSTKTIEEYNKIVYPEYYYDYTYNLYNCEILCLKPEIPVIDWNPLRLDDGVYILEYVVLDPKNSFKLDRLRY